MKLYCKLFSNLKHINYLYLAHICCLFAFDHSLFLFGTFGLVAQLFNYHLHASCAKKTLPLACMGTVSMVLMGFMKPINF